MSPKQVLLVGIITAVIISSISLLLPETAAIIYTSALQPIILLICAIFALRVARLYERELKMAFLLLSTFFIFYTISSISALWALLYSLNAQNTNILLLSLQILAYSFLFAACFYILKTMAVRKMSRYGWIALGVMFLIGILIVVYELPWMLTLMPLNPFTAIFRMVIRAFDVIVILVLLPVPFMYLQYFRNRASESITFTLIMFGLIFSLMSTYIFQMSLGISMETLAINYFQKGSVLDVVYMLGYLIVVLGLYVHIKYHEWGLKAITKLMAVNLS